MKKLNDYQPVEEFYQESCKNAVLGNDEYFLDKYKYSWFPLTKGLIERIERKQLKETYKNYQRRKK